MNDPLHKSPNRPAKQRYEPEAYVRGILAGDRSLLSQAITLIESNRPDEQQTARQIVDACLPASGQSLRIGITGSPGVGKSTFIESLGQYIIQQQHRLAVLTIDPSSQVSKGSILGDKTRMQKLAASEQAFIRPSPAGTTLGGVARSTRETIILCEAAGFTHILIETVGVGQSEMMVHSMVDMLLLLILPGAGDELQGIKRGIVEMADLIAINKAEQDRLPLARQAQRAYRNALHLYPPKSSGWEPKVVLCSALKNEGIDEIWQLIRDFERFTKNNKHFEINRQQQAIYWLEENLQASLQKYFLEHKAVQESLPDLKAQLLAGKITPSRAVDMLMKLFLKAD